MESKLTLPKTYGLLLDSFKGSDTILKMMFNRDEICTFLRLRMGIQNITKHNFTQQHLGQIKTVYPEAYVFKQEKLFIDFKNDYHLIIAPNLNGKHHLRSALHRSTVCYTRVVSLFLRNRSRVSERHEEVHSKRIVAALE